ncbi:MAG: acyl-CoA dehydrogenase family protein [Pseudomonadales bacterium]|nr:acyl-CoA dehydrogenase family protein [Pseudomonadales bacterium]MCP5185972.1 acyl-CoA dehydrogenase family protein [Pseudomonadales bacterium]
MAEEQDLSTATDEVIHETVLAWLKDNWRTDRPLAEWRNILVDGGWAAPDWPTECYGRGFSLAQAQVVQRAFREVGAVGAALGGPGNLAAHTILAHGNEAQKRRYLRPILTGEHAWCQLFSEPGSGSDLAGLTTRAKRDGDNYIINGQKVWNTSAHHADFGILIARTDWDAPKHQGISYFLINMRQPGVEVRPLRQMNGHASFNEVFLTDALVPVTDRLGNEGDGWRIASSTLSAERQAFSRDRGIGTLREREGTIYAEYAAEQAIAQEPYTWYPQRAGRVDLALPRAMATGAIRDPVVRQELARLLCLAHAAEYAAASAAATRRAGSNTIVPAGSIAKLTASLIARQASHVHTLVSGPEAMLGGSDGPMDGVIAEILLSVPAISIAGGTDEIQKNIISERVLGLPKEPRFDTGPFRDIPRNAS